MPQMAPINWLSLFIIFSITFLMFNMMNYYSYNSQMPKSKYVKMKFNTPMNWKW